MTDPNEIALYGLSADGVTPPVDSLQTMSHREAGYRNEREARDSQRYRWLFVSSLPAALNAERNEKAVKELRALLLGTRNALDRCERGKPFDRDVYAEVDAALSPKVTILSQGVNLSGSAE